MSKQLRRVQNIMIALALVFANAVAAAGYAFNETVPDVRLPASLSGGSACPAGTRRRPRPPPRPIPGVRWTAVRIRQSGTVSICLDGEVR